MSDYLDEMNPAVNPAVYEGIVTAFDFMKDESGELEDANVRVNEYGINVRNFYCRNTQMRGSIQSSRISGAFILCDLDEMVMTENVLHHEQFFVPLKFQSCSLMDVDFSGSDLRAVEFQNCSMLGVDFAGCRMEWTIMDGCEIDDGSINNSYVIFDRVFYPEQLTRSGRYIVLDEEKRIIIRREDTEDGEILFYGGPVDDEGYPPGSPLVHYYSFEDALKGIQKSEEE